MLCLVHIYKSVCWLELSFQLPYSYFKGEYQRFNEYVVFEILNDSER